MQQRQGSISSFPDLQKCVFMCVFMCACVYICLYVCLYVCMYVCVSKEREFLESQISGFGC